jgi:hypothetical protein
MFILLLFLDIKIVELILTSSIPRQGDPALIYMGRVHYRILLIQSCGANYVE